MDVPKIRLEVQGFKAIANASIIVDGITVVAGENGSGKSTLSLLLYNLFNIALKYDAFIVDALAEELKDIRRLLHIVGRDLPFEGNKDRSKREELRDMVSNLDVIATDDMELQKWQKTIDAMAEWYSFLKNDSEEGSSKRKLRLFENSASHRIPYIFADILGGNVQDNSDLPWEDLKKRVEYKFKKAQGLIDSRPRGVLEASFELPQHFEVFESGTPLIAAKQKYLSIPFSIQQVVYTNTPMVIGLDEDELAFDYWRDTDALLRKKDKSAGISISKIISEIIGGEVYLDDKAIQKKFKFKRVDGKVYDLLNCATGIKSFAMLQLLIDNGTLTDKTLLIIDEPEAHLHPQWIVEYARILVMLHKEIGVKFFIASHDPDMVSAIKYIAAKEKVQNKLNFYIAEKEATDDYLYSYNHLGQSFAKIFKSFNVAIHKIEEYGTE